MIKLLKNKEIRHALLWQMLVAAAGCTVSFCVDVHAGVAAVAMCLTLILIYYISTYMRYKKIRSLSEDINKLLHGDHSISIQNYCEGELGILHSEIYKMTVRLREQQQRLLQDKTYLADSLADISHQIRTPLTSINLLVQLLSEADLTEERRYRLTRELFQLLSRIDWLITVLLKISKLDAGTVQFKRETISMESLLRKACEPLLVPMELRGQTLKIQASGDFTGDVSWTCEALGNIVKNCMEHTPQNGIIEIEAEENALYTQVIIADNGTGIAGEDMPHIFERFYKGKNSDDQSFGVGLALSRMIITRQNGTVKAENRKIKGARFIIRFYKGTV